MVKLTAVVLGASICSGTFASPPGQAALSSEDRVCAGAEETAALTARWKILLTDEMLERELARMSRDEGAAGRLAQLYDALGNDPSRIRECLARPALVDRISRDRFAFDPALHAEARAQALDLRRELLTGELSPFSDDPRRTVLEIAQGRTEGVGHVSPLQEERDGFVLSVVLSETPGATVVAKYVVPKATFESWWSRFAVAGARAPALLPFSNPDLFSVCAAAGDDIVVEIDGDARRRPNPSPPEAFLVDAAGAKLERTASAWRAPYTGVFFAGVPIRATTATPEDYLLSIGVDGRSGAEQEVDLAVATSVAPDPVEAGDLLTYTIVVTNSGPDSAQDAAMLEVLPEGTTYVSATWSTTGGSWECVVPVVGRNGKVSCATKCLGSPGTAVFTITVKVEPCPGGAALTDTTTVSSLTAESDVSDNTATSRTTVIDPGTCDDGNLCTAGDHCAPGPGFTEDFDGVERPAIPSGWTATLVAGPVGAQPWRTSGTAFHTAPNAVFTPDAPQIRDSVLDSPPLLIQSTTAQLRFRNRYDLELGNDGGVLEIGFGVAPFQDILAAGGSFVEGGYTGTISQNFGSPIHGRQAWTGTVSTFVQTTVNLPAAVAGQIVVLRWRMATDQSLGKIGQWIDSVSVSGQSICLPGTAVACDDNDACTSDTCDGAHGCGHAPISCVDGNPCTDDACDPTLQCVHTNNTAACDDANVCTRIDACAGGTCHGTSALVCDDNNFCTTESCNPDSGCVYTDASAVSCNDNDVCTSDTCNPVSGCFHAANTVPCDDGNACTTGDTCGFGGCHGGPVRVCDDNDVCTNDSCNAISGCFHSYNAVPCDDGNACTSGDTCGGGTCRGGVARSCDDDDLCTADTCDAAIGCSATTANLDTGGFSAGRVDGRDLVVLARAWNSCPGSERYEASANLDPQSVCIDLQDFHLFMNAFGRACPS